MDTGHREFSTQEISLLTESIRSVLGPLEAEYLKARQRQKLGFILLILAFFIPNILSFFPPSTPLVVTVLVVTGYLIYKWFKLFFGQLSIIKKYNVSVNKLIFETIFNKLGLDGVMIEDGESKITKLDKLRDLKTSFKKPVISDSEVALATLSDLTSSELITEPHNTNQVDNVFRLNYKNAELQIAELDIKHVTGSGKNRTTRNIFHGYFAYFTLNRELTGKTFVSAEGDRLGFGNRSFFGANSTKETVLEWNEFEDLLHVAATDEVEARYILTPNFMHDLYTWWQGRETNIRLSFIKNRLFILYPDHNIRLNTTVEKITDETIASYIHTIAWPLQNMIKLIDDVRL